ncbi:hypothetical protein Rhow_000561 [Rhodococcus wratislaviensis]|uniref:Uncharacterized protein n=1 Tax=Rhodococcus wratislaviensis TaxID=44752 RepID=A0A402C290_RHOWR|nr:hypothetical protein Rhow_000561 [Rhodococcus wratislaviensis]
MLTDALVTGAFSAAAGFAAVLVAGALLVADLVTGAAGGAVFFPAAFVAEGFLAGAVRLRAFVACASWKARSSSAGIRPREDTTCPSPIAHSRISLVVFFAGAVLTDALVTGAAADFFCTAAFSAGPVLAADLFTGAVAADAFVAAVFFAGAFLAGAVLAATALAGAVGAAVVFAAAFFALVFFTFAGLA